MYVPAINILLIFYEYHGLSLSIGTYGLVKTECSPVFWLKKSGFTWAPARMGRKGQVLSEFVTIKALTAIPPSCFSHHSFSLKMSPVL